MERGNKLWKRSLEGIQTPEYEQEFWQQIESRLDKRDRRRKMVWFLGSGFAFILLSLYLVKIYSVGPGVDRSTGRRSDGRRVGEGW